MTKTFGLFGAAAVLAAAMALSGCGGGGGGVSGGAAPPRTVVYSNAAAEAATAAAANPVRWRNASSFRNTFVKAYRQNLDYFAVYQASGGVDSVAGYFVPPAVVVAAPNSKGPPSYFINYEGNAPGDVTGKKYDIDFSTTATADWSAASATHDTVGSLSRVRLKAYSPAVPGDRPVGRVAEGVFITDFDVTANDYDETGHDFSDYTLVDDPDTSGVDESKNPSGDDTDYMAAGVWTMGPWSGDDPDELTAVGAFAMGKVPYAGIGNVASTNTAVSYSGHAVGKRFANGGITDFDSTVSLTANFNTDKISGTVADVGGGQKLKLSEASIGTGSGGPYSGDTELLDKDGNKVTGYAGKWGGAFFGATDNANGPPGTAGTFGATGGDPSDSILGAFIAKK